MNTFLTSSLKYRLLVLVVLCSVGYSLAAADTTTTKSAFRQFFTVAPNEFVVPTVVAIALPPGVERSDVYVEDTKTSTRLQTYLAVQQTIVPTPIFITDANGLDGSVLTDGLLSTSQLYSPTETGSNRVNLYISSETSITTSVLTLSLAENVRLPSTITLRTVRPGGDSQILINTRPLEGQTIRFPEVTTDNFIVSLEYTQPLRIAELKFTERNPHYTETKSVRFLAQPKESYRVFINPDRTVQGEVGEQSNLRGDNGVVTLALGPVFPSSFYVMSDRDADGIVDEQDNCPDSVNTDQADIDNSRVGDACEDFDRDGVANNRDNCINAPNPNQSDEDSDGVGDACDDSESRLTEQFAWILWVGIGLAGLTLGVLFWIVARRDPTIDTKN